MATRLHLNGVNYDLADEPGGVASASRTMTDGMKTRKEFYLQVKTRQGNQITLTVNPEAVFAWAVYEWARVTCLVRGSGQRVGTRRPALMGTMNEDLSDTGHDVPDLMARSATQDDRILAVLAWRVGRQPKL